MIKIERKVFEKTGAGRETIEVKFKMARQIAKERKSKGLSQNVFSELIGVQREHIGKIETGRRNLTLDLLIKSCLILEIPVERVVKAEIFQKQE